MASVIVRARCPQTGSSGAVWELPWRPVIPALSLGRIDDQEQRFAAAFAAGDIRQARDLYHRDVVYLSPTTRLFGQPRAIKGVEATLDFIELTITGCRNISYRPDERALIPGQESAYTRIVFEWDTEEVRLRSTYVVVYRYREGAIGRQELYYDPSGPLERLGSPGP
jgi:ketosteroid isomerase-like protein